MINPIRKIPKSPYFLFFIPLIIYFFFGFQHLTQFETADEHFWIYDPIKGRIHNYWDAVKNKNWKATRINDKPGITLAYVSGAGLLFQKNPEERLIQKDRYFRVYNSEKTEEINFLFRLPILIFNGLFSLFFLWIIKKLTESDWLALISSTLILLNPILLGISQIVNPDSLLWVFSTASLLSFLTYLKKDEKKFAILASLFLGLSLLSKYSAIILIPFFLLAMVFHIIANLTQWKENGLLNKKIVRLIYSYFLILLGSTTVFSFMMPAVFADPAFLYKGTIGFKKTSPIWLFLLFFGSIGFILLDAILTKSKYFSKLASKITKITTIIPRAIFLVFGMMSILVLLNWSIGNNFLNIKEVSFDVARDKSFKKLFLYDKLFLELRPLIFSLTPLALFFVIINWFRSFWEKSKFAFLSFMISAFLLSFYFGVLTQGLLVHIRYSIMIYPLVMILAAIGIYELLSWEKLKKSYQILLFLGIVIVSATSIWLIKPFYFNYSNFLLGQKHIVTGAWGYGGYEAAQYLNSMPNAEELEVYTDYWGFCSFFKGICIRTSEFNKIDEHITDLKTAEVEKKIQEIASDNDPEDELAQEAPIGTEETAEVDNINAIDPENNDPETTNASEINDFDIDYYVITRRGSISNRKLWAKLKETIEKDPVWNLYIDNRPKNYIRIFEPDYNIFDLKNSQ